MDTHLIPIHPELVDEREEALRHMEAIAAGRERARSGRRPADAPPGVAPRGRRSASELLTPALFATLVAGLLALVAMGATVR